MQSKSISSRIVWLPAFLQNNPVLCSTDWELVRVSISNKIELLFWVSYHLNPNINGISKQHLQSKNLNLLISEPMFGDLQVILSVYYVVMHETVIQWIRPFNENIVSLFFEKKCVEKKHGKRGRIASTLFCKRPGACVSVASVVAKQPWTTFYMTMQ